MNLHILMWQVWVYEVAVEENCESCLSGFVYVCGEVGWVGGITNYHLIKKIVLLFIEWPGKWTHYTQVCVLVCAYVCARMCVRACVSAPSSI